ncbi:sensor histidine kinase [Auraticoccus cholistanensis]|nr:histidine kinase [Auraticoccus cholistanensis]
MSPSPGDLRRSTGRFVLYVHWSLYVLLLVELSAAVLVAAATDDGAPPGPALALAVAVVLHTAGNLAWMRWSLHTVRHPVPVPRRLRPLLALWVLFTLATVLLSPVALGGLATGWPSVAVIVTSLSMAAFAPRLPWWLVTATPVVTAALVTAVLAPVLGNELPTVAGQMVAVSLIYAFFVASFWLSGWMLRVMYALDDARGQSAQLAIAEERLRISRDLHDVFGRTLATVAVKSELAAELARRGRPERAADEMAQVRRIADEAGKEVRRVVAGVRGSDLPQELVGARSLLSSAGIECVLSNQLPEGRVAPEVGAVLGAVVREAVTNVIRHSRARSARITLRLLDGPTPAVELVVVNDGLREPEHDDGSRGNGLLGMTERLAAVGGGLSHRIDPDADTFTLTAVAPLATADAGAAPAAPPAGSPTLAEGVR